MTEHDLLDISARSLQFILDNKSLIESDNEIKKAFQYLWGSLASKLLHDYGVIMGDPWYVDEFPNKETK